MKEKALRTRRRSASATPAGDRRPNIFVLFDARELARFVAIARGLEKGQGLAVRCRTQGAVLYLGGDHPDAVTVEYGDAAMRRFDEIPGESERINRDREYVLKPSDDDQFIDEQWLASVAPPPRKQTRRKAV